MTPALMLLPNDRRLHVRLATTATSGSNAAANPNEGMQSSRRRTCVPSSNVGWEEIEAIPAQEWTVELRRCRRLAIAFHSKKYGRLPN